MKVNLPLLFDTMIDSCVCGDHNCEACLQLIDAKLSIEALSEMASTGEKAINFVTMRGVRMAARRERNRVAMGFSDEFGSEARYSDESNHPQGFSYEFLKATGDAQRAYTSALAAEKSSRQKLYAAVRKHARAQGVEK